VYCRKMALAAVVSSVAETNDRIISA